jgi:RND family efflux transporter MFP subunit
MSVRFFFKLLLFIAVVGGAVFAGLHFLRPVAVVEAAKRGTAVDSIPGTVTVKAERRSFVLSEISGRVAESNLELAASVSKGDILVQLDSRAIELEIKRLEGQLETVAKTLELGSSTRFELQNQRESLVYSEKLLERSAISRSEVDRQRRGIENLEQQIQLESVRLNQEQATLENAIQTNRLRLEQMTLRSPVDGVINAVSAFPGDLITGGAAIAEVVSLNREVEAKISEEYISKVFTGATATVQLQPHGYQRFPATVTKILPAADSQTQRYSIFLDVEIDREKLAPGTTGETSIVVARRENALLVPRIALVGNNVFVVKDGRVQVREVEAGFRASNEVEILSGLKQGEFVIVEQVDLFRDGDRVRVGDLGGK